MKVFLQKHRFALLAGGIITLLLDLALIATGMVYMNAEIASNPLLLIGHLLFFVIAWAFMAFMAHRYAIQKVLGLAGILLLSILAEGLMTTDINPFTQPLTILFWIGLAHLVLPEYFQKYRLVILVVYGIVLAYFFLDFFTTPNYSPEDRADFALYMILPVPLFAGLWIYEQWRWSQNLKADRTKAELDMLKSQVNPHFFFNTLNNLYGLVVEKSPQAHEVVLQLSDMMRYTIYEGQKEEVMLSDEVEYLENYIRLHRLRYQKKVEIDFNEEITKDVSVSPLLFIILLENAFKHGVESCSQDAFVSLSLTANEECIEFEIKNKYEESAAHSETGIGLRNLRKRLEHLYPGKHEFFTQKEKGIYTAQLVLKLY